MATALAAWIVPPFTRPGGNPVVADPGETPRSPVTTVGPVLVTVVPARTAKLRVVPKTSAVAECSTADVFSWAFGSHAIAARAMHGTPTTSVRRTRDRRKRELPIW